MKILYHTILRFAISIKKLYTLKNKLDVVYEKLKGSHKNLFAVGKRESQVPVAFVIFLNKKTQALNLCFRVVPVGERVRKHLISVFSRRTTKIDNFRLDGARRRPKK